MPTANDLHVMLDKVVAQAQLPAAVRQEALTLKVLADDTPQLVKDRLADLAAGEAATADYATPTTDLWRCVPVGTFQRHMAADEWSKVDADAFEGELAAQADPGAWARSVVSPHKVIFPADRSWLLAGGDLSTLSSHELWEELELGEDRKPPFLLFHLTVARLVAEGVGIRLPTALDAAAGGQPQWDPAGLAIGTEYLDRDVPIEAVERILWKP